MVIVHPPPGWAPRRDMTYGDMGGLTVNRPIRQQVVGGRGAFFEVLVEQRSRTVDEFRVECDRFDARYLPRSPLPLAGGGGGGLVAAPAANGTAATAVALSGPAAAVERLYWRGVPTRTPTYGADSPGSLFEQPIAGTWDLSRLATLLRSAAGSIPGVTDPFLYFGTFGATFAWHTEDADLHGINYIHTGAPKTWYAIPPADRPRFERLAANLYGGHAGGCRQFLRHKQCLMTPELLSRHGVDVVRATHPAGTFAVVFAGVYHAGFNHGWNVAESVNFGSVSWLRGPGRAAVACRCRPDSVSLDIAALEAAVFSSSSAAPPRPTGGGGGKAKAGRAGSGGRPGGGSKGGGGGEGWDSAGPPRRRRPAPPPPGSTAEDAAYIRELAAEVVDLQRTITGVTAMVAASAAGEVAAALPPPPHRGGSTPPAGEPLAAADAGTAVAPAATPADPPAAQANGAAAAAAGTLTPPPARVRPRSPDGRGGTPRSSPSAAGGGSPAPAAKLGAPPLAGGGSPVSIASAGAITTPSATRAGATLPTTVATATRPTALRSTATSAATLLRLSTRISLLQTAILARRPASKRARPRAGLPALGDAAVARLARASRAAILAAKRPPRPAAPAGRVPSSPEETTVAATAAGAGSASAVGVATVAGATPPARARLPPARRLEPMAWYTVPLGGRYPPCRLFRGEAPKWRPPPFPFLPHLRAQR
ncbi:hypothetical protein I4F81_009638 [Pyropia yezoensis]|uniref:Uncharacterized protein n=1 Tax=Pyropia yezoensis TaxID=2788 RepID=A0ACC3CB04_PYRYE|nr:hypothetical protein I4F81_009638 [Neopyropia yezoensis]